MSHSHESWMNDHQEGGGDGPWRSAKAVKAAALKKKTYSGKIVGKTKEGRNIIDMKGNLRK